MKLLRSPVWFTPLALLAALANPAPAWAQTASAPQVPVVTVGARAVDASLTLDATVQAVRQSTLSAQASGRVVQLLVKAGDRVRAGQALAVIDDRATQAGLAQASAGVAQAEAQLANAQAHYERTRDLRNQGFVAQAALDSAQAQWRAAQAGLKAAQAGQTQSSVAQGFTRLSAPYDGWVQATHADVGTLAQPGSPVVTVYAPQPLRAVVHVPASQHALAQQAKAVQVLLPQGDATGWVTPVARSVVPAADAVSQTVEWRLDLAPADSADLVPGRQVQVRFSGLGAAAAAPAAQRLWLPLDAVLRRGELTAVYVASAQGPFQLRAVRLGERTVAANGQAAVVVLAGLRAGERVALDPVRAGLAGARPAAQ